MILRLLNRTVLPHTVDSLGHERLAAAFVERDRRKVALAEAEGALERAQAAITEANQADTELAEAESAASAAATSWAESGGKDQPGGDAFDRAARARDHAYRAHLKADGVRKAVPKLQSDIDAARIALEPAEEEIDRAATAIVVASAEAEIESLRADFRQMFKRFTRLIALRNLLARNVPGTPWARYNHPCHAMTRSDCRDRLDEQLAELTAFMKEPHPDDSLAAAESFVREFRLLREQHD